MDNRDYPKQCQNTNDGAKNGTGHRLFPAPLSPWVSPYLTKTNLSENNCRYCQEDDPAELEDIHNESLNLAHPFHHDLCSQDHQKHHNDSTGACNQA